MQKKQRPQRPILPRLRLAEWGFQRGVRRGHRAETAHKRCRLALLLSAGEASGDMYAAQLAAELKKRMDVNIFGMGGPQMRAAGVEVVTDYSEVAVLGITEIIRHLPSLVRAMRRLVSEARKRKPALAILTDFPGFHLRLSRKLKPLGIKNVYFVCPQFWAWRPWRVRIVRRRFAQALCIFPFEEKFYGEAGVPTKFIGHPLVGAVRASETREQFAGRHGLDPSRPIITLLPGSRAGEIARHLPTMLAACSELRQTQGKVSFVIAVAPGVYVSQINRMVSASGVCALVVQDQTYSALAAADAALVCSGTATIEAALLERGHGGGLQSYARYGGAGQTAGSHEILQHGESDCGASGGKRTNPGRFYARRPALTSWRDCSIPRKRVRNCDEDWLRSARNWARQAPLNALPKKSWHC